MSSPPQSPLGRRAYGAHRRMSRHTVARNIADSILTHLELGEHRLISSYTSDPETQTLVQEMLGPLRKDIGIPLDATLNPPDLSGSL